MDTVLFRTAMSPGIREQHDEFPMIANLDGKMVVGQFGSFIYGFMQGYDGTIEEGDVFLTNDPYSVQRRHQPRQRLAAADADLQGRPPHRLGRDVRSHDRRRRQGAGLAADRCATRSSRKASRSRRSRSSAAASSQEDLLKVILHNCRLPTLEPLRLQRHRRGAAHRRAALRRDLPAASATTCSIRRWTTCSSATSARCAS